MPNAMRCRRQKRAFAPRRCIYIPPARLQPVVTGNAVRASGVKNFDNVHRPADMHAWLWRGVDSQP
jgi:hypothetical protein